MERLAVHVRADADRAVERVRRGVLELHRCGSLERCALAVARIEGNRHFIDIDPTSDRIFAGYAFSEPGPYTAQVVGADGTVLATWPSP